MAFQYYCIMSPLSLLGNAANSVISIRGVFCEVMKDEVNMQAIDYLTKVLLSCCRMELSLLGFGNRLGFDLYYCLCGNVNALQKLRCKCNFHALKFVPKIQEAGSLLIRRIRKYDAAQRMLDKQLVGEFLPGSPSKKHDSERGPSKYLALHLRLRMLSFTSLYPNLVTKETLLTHSELAPFRNFSSQLAALDFIACATADVFAMTDSGSQLSSLVSGFRTYYGGGHAPTLRPNKKRLAAILSENSTIGWNSFEDRVRNMIEEGQSVFIRGYGRSIYRQPRSPECMCRTH
ncbi:O-fucosyltransferase [Salix suchowensis]|nr:O-fucosyltransferase [Salix suchowensis]